MSFADKVKKAVADAPAAGYVNMNFGKLTTTVNILQWTEDASGARKPVRIPYTEESEIGQGQSLEITFKIGISELNPKLDFDYERNIEVKTSSEDGKFKTDWSEIVLPSLEKVFGKDTWADVITGKKPVYVGAEHVDSVKEPKPGKKNFGVPRFVARYASLEECKAARDERYPNREEAGEFPFGENANGAVPANVIEQAKSLLSSVKNNRDKFAKMLESKPFGEYSVEAILAAIPEE